MNTPRQSKVPSEDQRKALAESEKKADEKQPQNFKDEATADKKVEVGPDMTDDPIQGIDPE